MSHLANRSMKNHVEKMNVVVAILKKAFSLCFMDLMPVEVEKLLSAPLPGSPHDIDNRKLLLSNTMPYV